MLSAKIYEASKRREVSAPIEAKLHNVSIDEVRKTLKKLMQDGKIYQSSRPARSYWGATSAGYRAN